MTATTTTSPITAPLPDIGDVIDGNKLGDDILNSAASVDKNTKKIIDGGTSQKFQPQAWSFGGSVD